MLSYVALYRWTDQGAKNLAETVARARQATKAIEKAGGKLKTLVWTQGQYDLVGISEWPDEASQVTWSLNLARGGNIHSETMRAFTIEEMESILKKLG